MGLFFFTKLYTKSLTFFHVLPCNVGSNCKAFIASSLRGTLFKRRQSLSCLFIAAVSSSDHAFLLNFFFFWDILLLYSCRVISTGTCTLFCSVCALHSLSLLHHCLCPHQSCSPRLHHPILHLQPP